MRQTRFEIEEGVFAQIPAALPPALHYTRELARLISEADRALASLDTGARFFPHIEVMTLPSLLKEAVASVRLEGTRTTFDEVAEYSVQPSLFELNPDSQEAWNYSTAMKMGFLRLSSLPLSGRLLREVHGELMKGVRGENKAPGQFRNIQVRIGGTDNRNAVYIPPPHTFVPELVTELENYMNGRDGESELVRCALIHYQFEAIHPFRDGNGRLGRLLVSLYLHARKLLEYPILNISQYFEAHKEDYYGALEAVSAHGDWRRWIEFFLQAAAEQAMSRFDALNRLRAIYANTRGFLEKQTASVLDLRAVDIVFERLFVTARSLREHLAEAGGETITPPTSYHVIDRLTKLGFLREARNRKRPRAFYSPELMDFWNRI